MTARAAETEDRTFVQDARRSQLVGCAIEVIAEVGVEKASMVRIAERAGVSRGVIAYHFDDRDDLFGGVVEAVYALATTELGPDVAAEVSPPAALKRFIGGSVAFYAAHPQHMLALSAIFASGHKVRERRGEHTAEMLEVESILAAGQREGFFRVFDTTIMASTIRAALDVALRRIIAGDSADLLAHELVATFDAATTVESR
ncbi:TetR/AcrR family transcriptional regulator [Antrihabitans cavernicola]|uniref:TetR family transcriptional regulator n=1 Tax=Antrihabitans cavernicola TaxID=2495913 RepID=A0A5A7S881_9NOCA|nr:TetR/AcrR family transcriptional regulator [Spelaeibacter cavernicola]KAA0021684.1 TetR family transcriptional regulator [Spelaeibacter cavernicola]